MNADILLVDDRVWRTCPEDMVCREIRSRNRMLAVAGGDIVQFNCASRTSAGGVVRQRHCVQKLNFPALCKAVKLVSDGHTLCVRVGGETIGFEDVDAAYHRLVRLP